VNSSTIDRLSLLPSLRLRVLAGKCGETESVGLAVEVDDPSAWWADRISGVRAVLEGREGARSGGSPRSAVWPPPGDETSPRSGAARSGGSARSTRSMPHEEPIPGVDTVTATSSKGYRGSSWRCDFSGLA